MRRLLLIGLAPLLVSAADPVRTAEAEARAAAAEQQRLEQAASRARSDAERAAADLASAAQAMIAIDARIALGEAQLAEVRRRRDLAAERLAEARRPTSALLAGLAQAGRRPAWVVLTNAASADEQVRVAALVRALGPEVERRSAGLQRELAALAALVGRQKNLQGQLERDRRASLEAQQRFAERERAALAAAAERGREAFAAGDVVLDRSERLASLSSESEQRRNAVRLAAALAALPPAAPRPVPGEADPPKTNLAWQIPASGPVTVGLGELLDNGVRSRGLTIAAAPGTQVIAPAIGRIAFAGPFRRRAGVVVIDHGQGRLTLLSDVQPSVEVGDRVAAGEPVGRAIGPVTAELFRSGTAEPAALIARSSGPLLSGRTNG